MSPKYKLMYFPITALGEPIRFMLAYLGEDFVDNRVTMVEEWPKVKPTTPWGKVPVLEVDGQAVTQHVAITRYLGRSAGLSGKDAWEDLKIDEIVDVINELRSELAKYHYDKDEKKKAELWGPLVNEVVPFYMKKLDAHVKTNNGYLANGKLTWADLYFTAVCDYLSFMFKSDLTAGYPNMRALKDKVLALPKIKAYVEKRPKTEI